MSNAGKALAFASKLRFLNGEERSVAVVSPNGEMEALATAQFRSDSAFVAKTTTAEEVAPPSGRGASPVRICHVLTSLKIGGMERMVCTLMDMQAESGDVPFVFCTDEEGTWFDSCSAAGRMCGHRRPRLLFIDWHVVRALTGFARKKGITVFHAHNPAGQLYAVLASLFLGIPVLVTYHGQSYKERWTRTILRRCLCWFTRAVVAVSADVKKRLLVHEIVSSGKIHVIHNGIKSAKDVNPCRDDAKTSLGVSKSAFVIGSIGRLAVEKNYSLLFRAVRQMIDERRAAGNVRAFEPALILVGDGPDRASLEKLAVELGIQGIVTFAGSREDVDHWLEVMDVFCLPSLTEGLSIALLEAGMLGLPSVVTDAGGNAEVVQDGITGLIVPTDNVDSMVSALSRLSMDKDILKRMGQAAREHVAGMFSSKAMAAAYSELYRKIQLAGSLDPAAANRVSSTEPVCAEGKDSHLRAGETMEPSSAWSPCPGGEFSNRSTSKADSSVFAGDPGLHDLRSSKSEEGLVRGMNVDIATPDSAKKLRAFVVATRAMPDQPSLESYGLARTLARRASSRKCKNGFLLAITSVPAGVKTSLRLIHEQNIGNRVISAWTSLPGLRFNASGDGFSLAWGGYALVAPGPGETSGQIVFSMADSSLTIHGSHMFGLPFYYCVDPGGNFYCSTHIGLLKDAGVGISENKEVLPEYFIYRCVMPPFTLYKNIKRVLFGGKLRVVEKGNSWIVEDVNPPAWLTSEHQQSKGTFDDHVNALMALIQKSIREVSCGPDRLAVLLSGGLDSSIIYKLCMDILGAKDTYSTSFPFEDERLEKEHSYACSAAKALGSRHTHYDFTSKEYRLALIDSIAFAEQPVHHLQKPCFQELLKNGIPENRQVVVQALGAGGAFGNFRNHLYLRNKPLYHLLCGCAFRTSLELLSRFTGRGKTLSNKLTALCSNYSFEDYHNPIWAWHQYGDVDWSCRHFQTTPEAVISRQMATMRAMSETSIYHLWACYSLLGDEDVTMTLWSKIALSNSRFACFPFYDTEVLKYALAIPWEMKMRYPENRLRKALAHSLDIPGFIINRPKSGFGIKRTDWALEGVVFDPVVHLAGKVFDPAEIRRMRTETPAEAMTFWNIINYAIWKRICIDGESREHLKEELLEYESRVASRE